MKPPAGSLFLCADKDVVGQLRHALFNERLDFGGKGKYRVDHVDVGKGAPFHVDSAEPGIVKEAVHLFLIVIVLSEVLHDNVLDLDLFPYPVKGGDPARDQFLSQRTKGNGTSRFHNAIDLREHGNGVFDVTEDKDAGYCIEGAVFKWQFLTGPHEKFAVRAAVAGLCNHLLADVKSGPASPVLDIFLDKQTGSASDIEQVASLGEGLHEMVAQVRMVFLSPVVVVMDVVRVGDRVVMLADFLRFRAAHEKTSRMPVANAPSCTYSLLACISRYSASASAIASDGWLYSRCTMVRASYNTSLPERP